MGRAVGVQGAGRSPADTLVGRYALSGGGEAWHLDLYRDGQAGGLDFRGLEEGSAVLWVVEWPERGAGALLPSRPGRPAAWTGATKINSSRARQRRKAGTGKSTSGQSIDRV